MFNLSALPILPCVSKAKALAMRGIFVCLFALNALFGAPLAQAELAAVPVLSSPVTDLTQTLSPEKTAQLNQQLNAFSQQKGSQIAVLIVPTVEPEAIEQYSIRVVEAWKLGREKQDDGILLLIAKNDRKVRIEVGYGLEGAIPDLVAKRIISEIVSPSFKQGDFDGGIQGAVDTLIKLIEGEALPAPQQKAQSLSIENMLPILLIGGLFFGGILRSIFGEFLGGAINGGAIGFIAWMLGGGLVMAIIFAVIAFVVTLAGLGGLAGQAGGLGGGFGGGGGRDPFSGMGGGFGGGGASGDW